MRESGGLRRSRRRMITPDKRWTLPRYYRIWASMSTAGDIWPALSPVRGEGRPRGGKGVGPERAANVRVGRGAANVRVGRRPQTCGSGGGGVDGGSGAPRSRTGEVASRSPAAGVKVSPGRKTKPRHEGGETHAVSQTGQLRSSSFSYRYRHEPVRRQGGRGRRP